MIMDVEKPYSWSAVSLGGFYPAVRAHTHTHTQTHLEKSSPLCEVATGSEQTRFSLKSILLQCSSLRVCV